MTIDEDPSGATQLYNPDDPGAAGEWSVNISEDETRNMPPHEIAYEYLQGNLDGQETYVWREGMGDWIPLDDCAELQQAIAQYQQAGNSAAAAADAQGFDSTVMIDGGPGSGAASPRSDPFALGDPGPGARSPMADSGRGAPPPSQPPGPLLTGARNEASALFNVADILQAQASVNQARTKPKKREPSDSLDDLFSLGGGGIDGGIAGAFAPPPMNAPAPPPPPKPEPAPIAAAALPASLAAAQLAEPPPRSKRGLFIGIGAGVVVLLGFVIAFAVAGGGEETVAQNTTSTDTSSPTDQPGGEDPDTSAEGDKKDDDKKDDDKKDDDKKDDDKKDDDKKDDDKKDDGKATTGTTTGTTTATKKDDDKKDDAKKDDDKKDDAKKDDTKSAGEFNVNAARSALGSAAGAASGCGKPSGKKRKSRATVTFAPSGRVTSVQISGGAAGTSAGSCAANIFRGASIPPFSGSPQTVAKTFYVQL